MELAQNAVEMAEKQHIWVRDYPKISKVGIKKWFFCVSLEENDVYLQAEKVNWSEI